ncbi:MAG: TolC family protein [Paraprevotella sp.]|nr:TolC family protein [Paraprevotella sp.]
MRTTKYILLLFAMSCLSGCGLYSKWDNANIEYDVEKICEMDTITPHIAEMSWRELFTDQYLVDWIDTALYRNTDLRIAKYKVEQAAATLKASRLAFLPSVGVNVEGSVSNNSSDRFQIALSASWEIDIFGKQRNLNFQQKLLDAGMEANDALTSWQTARDRLTLAKKQIVALKGAVHNTRLLMRNTNTNYLEVLTAQQRLLEAELTEAADRYDAIQAIISLYHALGGGTE